MLGQHAIAVALQQALPSAAPEQAGNPLGGIAVALAVIALLFVLLAAKAGRVALSLWLAVAFPRLSRACIDRYRVRPWACFAFGFVNLFVGILLALLLIQTGVLALLGLLLLLGMGVLAVVGYGAAYRHLAARLFDHEPPLSPLREHLTGGLAAEAAFLAPILGQLLCVAVLCRGFGAALLALVALRKRRVAPTETEPVTPVLMDHQP